MIGIITLPSFIGYNYGGILQNYALTYYLNKNNYQTKAIRCDSDSIKDFLKLYIYNNFNIILGKENNRFTISYDRESITRNKNFKEFIKNNIASQEYRYYCNSTYKKIDKTFNKVIVGSDQVWNPIWAVNDRNFKRYFLQFISQEKRISYAASFGVEKIPEQWNTRFSEAIKDFNAISLREESGKNIIRDLCEINSEVVLDPTMLLTTEEWRNVSKKSKIKNDKPYLVKYFLGKESTERQEYIQSIADKNQLEVYDLLDKKNSILYSSGPSEFLDLIDNASLVCTDSFHAVVFSILFSVPFLIMEREQEGVGNMSSRITTLLSKLNLENRMPGRVTEEDIFACDYINAYKILQLERIKANDFLKKALT
ncbi:MAG: polysaccharide pyruvyl transferase family protein [Clostridium butyricum]